MAFGLKKPLEPSIGRFIASRVSFNYVNKNGKKVRNKVRTELNVQLCKNTKNFHMFNQSRIDMYGIPQMYCFTDPSELAVQGDFYSEFFTYLEIKLLKCSQNITS